MALMMKVCGLFERNAEDGNPYRYLTGSLNEQTRVVVMPNRNRHSSEDPDWFLYLAPLVRTASTRSPGAAGE
ncbi:MAG: hypothetical protein ACHQF3_05535 [Alphaproteobacteria bacterium]